MIWSQSIDVVYYLVFLCVNLCTLRNLSRSHVFLQLWDFHEYYISCVSAYANDLWKNPFVSSLINEAHCICMLIYLEIRQTLSPGILLHASSVCYCCEGQICSAFCVSCYSVSIRSLVSTSTVYSRPLHQITLTQHRALTKLFFLHQSRSFPIHLSLHLSSFPFTIPLSLSWFIVLTMRWGFECAGRGRVGSTLNPGTYGKAWVWGRDAGMML